MDNLIELMKKDITPKYQVVEKIGEGSFGLIYKGKESQTQMPVAIKYVDKQMFSQYWAYIEEEVSIMKNLSNDNIIRLYDIIENDKSLYMILELANMDLEILWSRHFAKKMPEDVIKIIIKQLMNGFSLLHEKFIIHRDIKLENIMVVFNENELETNPVGTAMKATYKIADFGLAKQLKTRYEKSKSFVGSIYTMDYLAPEIQLNKTYTLQADMYSFGSIVYQLLEGDFPFVEKFNQELINEIKKQQIVFSENVSPSLQDLIRRMLKYDSEERIQWDELSSHQFINNQFATLTVLDCKLRRQSQIYKKIQQSPMQSPCQLNRLSLTNISNPTTPSQQQEFQSILEKWPETLNEVNHTFDEIEDLNDQKELPNLLKQKNRYNLIMQFIKSLAEFREKDKNLNLQTINEEFHILAMSKILTKEMKKHLKENEKLNKFEKIIASKCDKIKLLQKYSNPSIKSEINIKEIVNQANIKKSEIFELPNSQNEIEIQQIAQNVNQESTIKQELQSQSTQYMKFEKEQQNDEFQNYIRKIFKQLNKLYKKDDVSLNQQRDICLLMIKAMKIWRTFEQDQNNTILEQQPGFFEAQVRFRVPNKEIFQKVLKEVANMVDFKEFIE